MVDTTNDYLLPEVRKIVNEKGSEERIYFVERDCWIGYSRAIAATIKLESLFHHPSR